MQFGVITINIKKAITVLLLLPLGQCLAVSFDNTTLNSHIEHVDGMVIDDFSGNGSKDLLLLGRNANKQKQLQLLGLNQGKSTNVAATTIALDSNALFYDVGHLANSDKAALVLMMPGRIAHFDMQSQTLKTLISSPSIYRNSQLRTSALYQQEFLHDFNQDGLSDVIIADFDQSYVFIQQSDGHFLAAQSIQMPADMRLFSSTNVLFMGPQRVFGDYNFDGQTDIIYRQRDQLLVFLQDDGKFSKIPLKMALKLAMPLSDEYDELDKDHSNLVTHEFYKLIDLNNDGALDLISQVTKSAGLLDKSSRYQFYFGAKVSDSSGQTTLHFKPQPDSQISSEGLQFELTLVDFNGDGQLDLASPSYELGIGSIISSLFSSSADLDLMFHPLVDDGHYNTKPLLKKEISVEFDLNSGQQVYPLFKINDFNGDGLADLLTASDGNKLYLRPGQKGKRLFARKAQKIKMALPRNGRLITPIDLNDDKKMDLVIRYDKLDGQALSQQIKILLAR